MGRWEKVGSYLSNILRKDDVARSRIEDGNKTLLDNGARIPIRVDSGVVHSPEVSLDRFGG